MSAPRSTGRGHVPRVFVAGTLADDDRVRLTGDRAHHLRTVLRLRPGADAILFDGAGGELPATIESADRHEVILACGRRRYPHRESALRVTLGQAVARGDRMDYAVAKAVELGVTAIQPLLAERGKVRLDAERAARKRGHWQRVAVAAAEQSGRELVPEIAEIRPLAKWLDAPPAGTRLMLEPAGGAALRSLPAPERGQVALLAGPESGWSTAEVELAERSGFRTVGLGPRVLRAETAGVACLAALQTLWGDIG